MDWRCRASLARLGIEKMALYQQHWPAFGTNWWCSDAFIQVCFIMDFATILDIPLAC